MKLRVLLPALTLVLVGCGSIDPGNETNDGSGGEGGGSPQPQGALLPWAVGNQWTYAVNKDGVTTTKTTTVGALEPVGGEGPHANAIANHVVTRKGAELTDRTESWQAPSEEGESRIVRFREQSFDASRGELELEEYWDPPKLHVDGSPARTTRGASWLESYQETKLPVGLSPTTHAVRERWTVLDDDATLEVPAGTFDHVVVLQKVGGSSTKQYWYRRGVGKLKETGAQTEELSEYELEDAP